MRPAALRCDCGRYDNESIRTRFRTDRCSLQQRSLYEERASSGVDRWLSAAVALSRVIVPLAFFGVIAGLPIWTLATSVVLTRKEPQ
jgi:hypothetical protein